MASELRKVLFARLNGALGDVPIYDHVPADAGKLYVSFGPASSLPDDDKVARGREITHQIDVWCETPSAVLVENLLEAIDAELLGAPIEVPGFAVWYVENSYSQILIEPDGIGRHGLQRWKFRIHPLTD